MDADTFIAKWQGVAASELSTSQSFLIDLCLLLGVPTPHPTPEQDYLFERPVTFQHGDGGTSAGRIDLYRRGAFVLESKKLRNIAQPQGLDEALLRARSQAEGYARALPAEEGRPPFVIVVDVGRRIELYAEFSRSGATYTPFPDPSSHRLALTDLARPEIRERLRRIWMEPLSLDPSRESARVTRDIAGRLAELAKSLEASGHHAESVAQFLMRCLFTMFAEDVRLLPADSFRDLLVKHSETPDIAMRMLGVLWQDMDRGGFSGALAAEVLRFNGKLFKDPSTLPLDKAQLLLLIDAARADWKQVEPAIFGTLLERALSPLDRHKLGAHFTPRAYVERLVLPTVIEPLRAEWKDAQAASLVLASEGNTDDAITVLRAFHHRLCAVRVLDPACGSGNFLYVTLEHLKRLEGEVLNALDESGWRQAGLALEGNRADSTGAEMVDPHNLLGIELNPRAAAIAEVVLWIGYLQWHFRTHGTVNPPEPVVRDFHNIECRDAMLAYDRMEFVIGDDGRPVTRWNGRTMKTSPVTGELVPDENARVPVERYVNPRKAEWPAADFVVGNPPFIGGGTMRDALGSGYVDALRSTWSDVPESADLVMFWWHIAALSAREHRVQRFGFITTNSIKQTFNRRVLAAHLGDAKQPLSIVFAIPDHPWVDAADGAAVRIAMTVCAPGAFDGLLLDVTSELSTDTDDGIEVELTGKVGHLHEDLRIGANVAATTPLTSNLWMAGRGLQLMGSGFIVTPDVARNLGLGRIPGLDHRMRPYRHGRDLTTRPRDLLVIDLFGLSLDEVRNQYPAVYQHVFEHVKPERDAKADSKDGAAYARLWWLHGKPRQELRSCLKGLSRYIVTVETTKHRVFQFLSADIAPDNALVCIAIDDAAHLGALTSAVHVTWALAAGGRLGVGNDPRYNKTRCFDPFPFPDWPAVAQTDASLEGRIRDLAERLDSHRKQQQSLHSELTLTGMYNVLEALRAGTPLSAKERVIHEQGLVSVLRELHDELDAAVLAAYGWSDLLPVLLRAQGNDASLAGQTRDDAKQAFDEAILERLVALNFERAAAEARGEVLWLRPEFQNPGSAPRPGQQEIDTRTDADDEPVVVASAAKATPWPKDPVDQIRAVSDLLLAARHPLALDDITARFSARGPWKRRVGPLLDMLVAIGRASEQEGRYRGLR